MSKIGWKDSQTGRCHLSGTGGAGGTSRLEDPVGLKCEGLPCAKPNGGNDLTLDELKLFDLQLFQLRHGYRYSLDPLLLARFCTTVQPGGKIVDLGAGCGIISLVLARVNPAASVVAVENNPETAALVERNIQHNDLGERIFVNCEDVINLRKSYPVSTFDLVASNPPFRAPGSGKSSPLAGRDAARHETTAGLSDFLAVAKYLVKPGGKICFIQHPSRLTDFIAHARELKLALHRLRMVHDRVAAPATMFLAELAKGSRRGLAVEAPLILRDERGIYSDEVAGRT